MSQHLVAAVNSLVHTQPRSATNLSHSLSYSMFCIYRRTILFLKKNCKNNVYKTYEVLSESIRIYLIYKSMQELQICKFVSFKIVPFRRHRFLPVHFVLSLLCLEMISPSNDFFSSQEREKSHMEPYLVNMEDAEAVEYCVQQESAEQHMTCTVSYTHLDVYKRQSKHITF